MTTDSKRFARTKKFTLAIGALLVVGAIGVTAGCVRSSGGVLYFSEASRPEGWPELTPVGEVEVRSYPDYRAAWIREVDGDLAHRRKMNAMFRPLFNHIKDRDIAMTAPVEMTYDDDPADPEVAAMAFLYRRPTQGEIEQDGAIRVEDLPAQTYASIGVRGDYTDDRFAENLVTLDAWLETHADEWRAAGPPRYLGYNGPFTPWFWRYGEVQRPVERVGE